MVGTLKNEIFNTFSICEENNIEAEACMSSILPDGVSQILMESKEPRYKPSHLTLVDVADLVLTLRLKLTTRVFDCAESRS